MASSSPPASGSKPVAHSVKRHYKPALKNVTPSNERVTILRSLLVRGKFIELIGAENEQLEDDAYTYPIRQEICNDGPFRGKFAKKLGLFHIASRRVSHENGAVLKRHTGPKKDANGNEVKDSMGQPTFFPRQYILRLIQGNEQDLSEEEHTTFRRKVLVTCAYILREAEKKKNASAPRRGSTKMGQDAQFKPTHYKIPDDGLWDLTPEALRPLDWYITDRYVETVIRTVYVEEEIGTWHMFSENVPEADCFFSPPYSHIAQTYGFRNPNQSSVRHPVDQDVHEDTKPSFDERDVIPLDS